jgi:hypothetical protein
VRRVAGWTAISLPWAERAYIPQPPQHRFNKLKDYALNPDHDDGGSKAELFRRRLGLGQDDWECLHDQIIERVPGCRVARKPRIKVVKEEDPARQVGLEFEVHVPIDGRGGLRCLVLTAWRLDARLRPSLTTTYPLA